MKYTTFNWDVYSIYDFLLKKKLLMLHELDNNMEFLHDCMFDVKIFIGLYLIITLPQFLDCRMSTMTVAYSFLHICYLALWKMCIWLFDL